MSDPKGKDPSSVLKNTRRDFTKEFPDFTKTITGQIRGIELGKLGGAKAVTPGYNKLQTDQYAKSAPKLAKTGAKVDAISRLGATDTDVKMLNDSGTQLATSYKAADKTLNPEFYDTREKTSGKLGELLGSINLNNANPEAERLISQENARSGNLSGPSNATNTVANALSFGKELDARRDSLGRAIGSATSFLPASKTAFNPVDNALTRGPTNTGVNNFLGVQKPGDQAFNLGQSLLDAATGIHTQSQDIEANRRQGDERVNDAIGSC